MTHPDDETFRGDPWRGGGLGSIRVSRVVFGVSPNRFSGGDAGNWHAGTRALPDPYRAATISEAGFNSLVPVDDPLRGMRVLQWSSQLRGKTVGPDNPA